MLQIIALRRMPQNILDKESTPVQVIVWCCNNISTRLNTSMNHRNLHQGIFQTIPHLPGVRCCFWLKLSSDLTLNKSCLNFWLKSEIRLKSETAPHPWSNVDPDPGPILGLRPANERRRYKVTRSLIGWVQTWNQPWDLCSHMAISWSNVDPDLWHRQVTMSLAIPEMTSCYTQEDYTIPLKREGRQFDNFAITGGTISCRNDDLLFSVTLPWLPIWEQTGYPGNECGLELSVNWCHCLIWLTHWSLVTHICISELVYHWFT